MIPDELGRDNGCDGGASNGEQHGVSLCCALNYGTRPEPRMNGMLRILARAFGRTVALVGCRAAGHRHARRVCCGTREAAMQRRTFLKVCLAGTTFAATGAFSETQRAASRQTLSFGLRSSEMVTVEIKETSTYLLSVPLETAPIALRVGLANTTTVAYVVDGICCSRGDFDAAPSSDWIQLAPAAAGSDHASRHFNVPGNRAPDAVSIVWSQWTQINGADGPGRPQMTFRILVRPQSLPLVRAYPGDLGVGMTSLSPKLIREAYLVGDYVTDPLKPLGSGTWTPDSPLFVVQYRTSVPGIQIVVGGDSHLAGWDTFIQLAATDVSRPAKPVSVWNGARSGAPSRIFAPILDEIIADADPSIVVIQAWTANDGMRPAADLAYLDRVQAWASRVLQYKALPIILKGLPRNLFGTPELRSWQQVNERIDALVPGAVVFDPNPFVEDRARPGNWKPEFSKDGVHPNLQGNLALAVPFAELLRSLI
jgi:hypothetical protein